MQRYYLIYIGFIRFLLLFMLIWEWAGYSFQCRLLLIQINDPIQKIHSFK